MYGGKKPPYSYSSQSSSSISPCSNSISSPRFSSQSAWLLGFLTDYCEDKSRNLEKTPFCLVVSCLPMKQNANTKPLGCKHPGLCICILLRSNPYLFENCGARLAALRPYSLFIDRFDDPSSIFDMLDQADHEAGRGDHRSRLGGFCVDGSISSGIYKSFLNQQLNNAFCIVRTIIRLNPVKL